MIDQTLRIKVLIININTAELSDKIKNVLFVDSGTIFECKSLMAHLCFLYFMTLMFQQMILIMIQRKSVNGFFGGK